jgi:hypothetical protein
VYKPVSRILEGPVPDHRKPLARRASEHDRHPLVVLQAGGPADILGRKANYASGQDCAAREVVLVNRGVDWIDVDGGTHVKTGLLEP